MQRLDSYRVPALLAGILGIAPLTLLLGGCGNNIEAAAPRPRSTRAERIALDVPRIMRGTVAAETVLVGYSPVLVRGYGLVVGLNGTGTSTIPPSLRAHMLGEMMRRGVGQSSSGAGHLNPERMLDSEDTAVVIVEGVILPGSVGRAIHQTYQIDGTRFDVRVFADPRTGTTSLEGGRLYTAELRPVLPGETLPPTGSKQAAATAEASGPIFINPFAEPGRTRPSGVRSTVGRIMAGGVVRRGVPLKLRLATPSHARAKIVQSAINTRFPEEPGQTDPTAHGESAETIAITIPTSWRNRPDEFIELLRHTTLRQTGTIAVATSIKTIVMNDPGYSNAASLRWEALGARALPVIRELYDYPEDLPRAAAIRAGARLDDPQVTPWLIEMSKNPSVDARRTAVELIGDMRLDPRIDMALQARLDDEDVDVRLAAYEAATRRMVPFIVRIPIDGKFTLDIVDSEYPMLYITQTGAPRIALFGHDVALSRPLLVDAWSGRLLLKSSPIEDEVEVYYRSVDGDVRIIESTTPRLADFIAFLGHQTTIDRPAPGLGLSYGETVGALYEIWRQDSIAVDFKSQQDRVLAAILRSQMGRTFVERPEFSDPNIEDPEPMPWERAIGEDLPGQSSPPDGPREDASGRGR